MVNMYHCTMCTIIDEVTAKKEKEYEFLHLLGDANATERVGTLDSKQCDRDCSALYSS